MPVIVCSMLHLKKAKSPSQRIDSLRRADIARGTTQIAFALRQIPLIGCKHTLSTDAADAKRFYGANALSSSRLRSDKPQSPSWLAPTAISLGQGFLLFFSIVAFGCRNHTTI